MSNQTERSALISVFNKDGIEKIARKFVDLKIKIIKSMVLISELFRKNRKRYY